MTVAKRAAVVVGACGALIAFGLSAEWIAYGPGGWAAAPDAVHRPTLDLATGLVLTLCGGLGWAGAP